MPTQNHHRVDIMYLHFQYDWRDPPRPQLGQYGPGINGPLVNPKHLNHIGPLYLALADLVIAASNDHDSGLIQQIEHRLPPPNIAPKAADLILEPYRPDHDLTPVVIVHVVPACVLVQDHTFAEVARDDVARAGHLIAEMHALGCFRVFYQVVQETLLLFGLLVLDFFVLGTD
jgi:hypothetical protein